jgi:hypothetical protein
MKDLGIVGNGNDGTLGNFDMARVQKIIQIMSSIMAAQKQPIAQGLQPEQIATNEFIDPKISLPS